MAGVSVSGIRNRFPSKPLKLKENEQKVRTGVGLVRKFASKGRELDAMVCYAARGKPQS